MKCTCVDVVLDVDRRNTGVDRLLVEEFEIHDHLPTHTHTQTRFTH
jgi:hypothetical protein